METAGRSATAIKIIITILFTFVLAVGVFLAFKFFEKNKSISEEPQGKTLGVEDGTEKKPYEIEIDRAALEGEEEIELAYEYPAVMGEIVSPEGSAMRTGDPIVRLDVKEMELQKKQLEAVLVQARANLQKVGAGATQEDIDISKTKKDEAEDSLDGAKNGLTDALRGGFTACDDAVSAKTNDLFSDPEGTDPQLTFTPSPASLESTIESKRRSVNSKIESLSDKIDDLDSDSDFADEVDDIRELIVDVQGYLNSVAQAVNSLTAGAVDQDTIDAWKSSVSAGRAEIESAKVIINETFADFRETQGYFSLSERELTFKEAKARSEDIIMAQARVNEVQGQISVLDERIRKSVITAPFDGRVMKIWFKRSELVPAFQRVVSFSSDKRRVSADVLEDDIRNVRPGKKATVKFRGLPEKSFAGTVDSIEDQRMIIDGDVYYRAYISIDELDPDLRSGMSADVFIAGE